MGKSSDFPLFLLRRGELMGRLDPYFYTPEFIEQEQRLRAKKAQPLRRLVDFSGETWGSGTLFTNTFPYLEISQIDTQTGTIAPLEPIPVAEAPSRAKMVVRRNDIVVSMTRPNRGAIASLAHLAADEVVIASTGFAVIRRVEPVISREYLFAALRSEASLQQMQRHSTGGNYPAITLPALGQVLIPVPSDQIQQQAADALLASLDTYLLGELGITLPAPSGAPEPPYFLTSWQHTTGERWDPAYHHTYFLRVAEAIRNGKYPVRSLLGCTARGFTKGFLPPQAVRGGQFRVAQINTLNMDGSFSAERMLTVKDNYPQSLHLRRSEVVVVITGATIGKVGYWELDEAGYFLGGDLLKFRASADCDAYYLYAFLRTQPVQSEMKRHITGATNGHLSPHDVGRFLIPAPPLDVQQRLGAHVRDLTAQARTLRAAALAEFAAAKAAVELLILQ